MTETVRFPVSGTEVDQDAHAVAADVQAAHQIPKVLGPVKHGGDTVAYKRWISEKRAQWPSVRALVASLPPNVDLELTDVAVTARLTKTAARTWAPWQIVSCVCAAVVCVAAWCV